MDSGHESLRLYARRARDYQGSLLVTALDDRCQPSGEMLKIGPHFDRHLQRKGGQLACKKRADTKWTARILDTLRPKTGIGLQQLERIAEPAFNLGQTSLGPCAIAGDKRAHQIDLAWKMMMDAGFADSDNGSDVGITEPVIAARYNQLFCAVQDFVIGSRKIAHR